VTNSIKEIYCTEVERIIKIIHACCILHNLCIDMNDLLPLEDDIDSEIENIEIEHNEIDNEREEMAGNLKREYLANFLMQ
jgi:hypothetical protein